MVPLVLVDFVVTLYGMVPNLLTHDSPTSVRPVVGGSESQELRGVSSSRSGPAVEVLCVTPVFVDGLGVRGQGRGLGTPHLSRHARGSRRPGRVFCYRIGS